MPADLARYWIGTLFDWTPPDLLPPGLCWLRGQQEICPTTQRSHYQVIAGFTQPRRLAFCKRVVGPGHWEPTRSSAADSYVWKDQTSVEGTRFELGQKALRRNNGADWAQILHSAKTGNFESIPADITIRYYRSLVSIASDFEQPVAIEKTVNVFFGRTETGKSRRAWDEAGVDAYPKV